MIFLEGKGIGQAILIILLIMYSPAIILTIIGFALLKKNKKRAKNCFIAAVVYVVIGLGICGMIT